MLGRESTLRLDCDRARALFLLLKDVRPASVLSVILEWKHERCQTPITRLILVKFVCRWVFKFGYLQRNHATYIKKGHFHSRKIHSSSHGKRLKSGPASRFEVVEGGLLQITE